MVKHLFLIFVINFTFTQQTIFEELPISQKLIDSHLISNIKHNVVEVNDQIINEKNSIIYDTEYLLFQKKYRFNDYEKVRIVILIDSFPENGKLFLSYSNNQFEGPLNKNNIINTNELVSGLIESNYVILKYLHPINEPYPSIILNQIIDNEIYKISKKIDNPLKNIFIRNNYRNNNIIMVTGYWPPTNEMVRHFSQNTNLNPEGWQGQNWENTGYDIVSFFPEFDPPNCDNCGIGFGDLEVDYQNTTEDFWPLVNSVRPLGIITFSRGYNNMSWELEMNTYNRFSWISDYSPPYQPTPSPPDQDNSVNFLRQTTLPINQIRDRINDLNNGLNSYIDYDGDAGSFLSEYMGFHGIWYKDLYFYDDNNPCISAGHIHVGSQVPIEVAKVGAEESIRILIDYLNQFIYTSGDVNNDTHIDILDIILIVNSILGQTELSSLQILSADLNENGIINVLDIIQLVNLILIES
tara:strand:- start:669 stop:2069 length:1401 start_codon:yes stop_codon:yes gene_type:complete